MSRKYFERVQDFNPYFSRLPSHKLGIAVVIPSYNETELEKSLQSLIQCQRPTYAVEVLVVVNFPENSDVDIINNADWCFDLVEKLDKEQNDENFRIFPIKAYNLPKKHAGVGLARKIGMDQAAWRLNINKENHKIIVCFDADATCSPNYLIELEKLWLSHPETEACSIRYEHPIEGNEFDELIYNGIAQYELHLRYYIQAGKLVGHPYSYHTVGSSMACSADAYMRYGGMNKNKAGEDFYFLQKIIPHGKFRELNTTCIFPSPRPSHRVPFGTGRAMIKFMEKSEENYLTYNLYSWLTLKPFFENSGKLFSASKESAEKYLQIQGKSLQDFLEIYNFSQAIEEINANTSNPESFQKRFFQWFDAFMLLKYLNFANENYYSKQPINSEAYKLGKMIGIPIKSESTKDLLIPFRNKESIR